MALVCRVGASYGIRHETARWVCGSKESSFSTKSTSWDGRRTMQGLRLDGMMTKGGSKHGSRLVVAASPPMEDAVVAAEPLTKEDLVSYLASGCKPKEKWRLLSIYFLFWQE
ncbi:hypothetical protein Droror1_Dr00005352 [Drosera rotundifolia]